MSSVVPVSAKLSCTPKPLVSFSHHHHHHQPSPFLSKPLSCFRSKNPSFSLIKATSSAPRPCINTRSKTNQQSPSLLIQTLKTTLITTVTAATLFLSRFHLKPALAALAQPPPPATTTQVEEVDEQSLEQHLAENPNDVDALRNLMEIRIKSKKIPEAIEVIDRLMELEPEDVEWPLLKSHMYVYNGDVETAKQGFNEILKKDPLRVEAYHGLVMAASQDDSVEDLKNIEKRIEEGIKLCKKENKKADLRDFKLLLAQIRVIEGKYDDALKVYKELVKEEPRDFRPYLCQGIIYTLLRKKDEAEKCFEKYQRLVPKGHPYARYFDDNMMATKVFSQKVENERAAARS